MRVHLLAVARIEKKLKMYERYDIFYLKYPRLYTMEKTLRDRQNPTMRWWGSTLFQSFFF